MVQPAVPAGSVFTREAFIINERTIRLMERKEYGTGGRARLLEQQNRILTAGGKDRVRINKIHATYFALSSPGFQKTGCP
jgi:hypothetical protein